VTGFPKELGLALFKAQGMMRGIAKDGTNPHYKSRYATLENVTDTIRPVLQECGVLFMQAPGSVDEHGVMSLATRFVHVETGQAIETVIGVPLVKRDPQGVGSAITYACRYSLMALLGLPPVDDDGQSAGQAETPTPRKVLSVKDAPPLYIVINAEIAACKTTDELNKWMRSPTTKEKIAQLPLHLQDDLRIKCHDTLEELRAAP
jgi:hypothetical protein